MVQPNLVAALTRVGYYKQVDEVNTTPQTTYKNGIKTTETG
jgi:hypothetical protein